MRIWHYKLIEILQKKQLTGQWRELSAICGLILKFGTPKSLIVDRLMDYPISHFKKYIGLVKSEMQRRGLKPKDDIYIKLSKIDSMLFSQKNLSENELFKDWHTQRYLKQCFYNLQEKFDCGGISGEEWKKIKTLKI